LTEGTRPVVSADGETLYFVRAGEAGSEILGGPLAGGPWRRLAAVPSRVLALSFGGDGAIHFTRVASDSPEAWRLTVDGRLEREAPAPYDLVLPAPVGGWRVAGERRGDRRELELIPPDGELGAAGNRRVAAHPCVWDASGRSLIAVDDHHYLRVGIDGHVEELLDRTPYIAGIAVSPDGATLYTSLPAGHVRREAIINYGDRPRPR
jgi:hypothetical protein